MPVKKESKIQIDLEIRNSKSAIAIMEDIERLARLVTAEKNQKQNPKEIDNQLIEIHDRIQESHSVRADEKAQLLEAVQLVRKMNVPNPPAPEVIESQKSIKDFKQEFKKLIKEQDAEIESSFNMKNK